MKTFSETKQIRPTSETARIDLGWRLEEKWLQIARQFLEAIVHPDESLGVFDRELGESRFRALALGPPRDDLAVGKRNLNRRVAWNHAQAVLSELQILNDFRPQHAGYVGSGGHAAAGCDFFRNAATADDLAALENESGKSSPSEISRSRQAVMAATDNNRVVGFWRGRRHEAIDLQSEV